MKLHRNLAEGVVTALREVFIHAKQADTTIEHLLHEQKRWGARDRNFVAENFYYIVRYKRLLEYCANTTITDDASLWQLLATKLVLQEVELPAWDVFSVVNAAEMQQRFVTAQNIRTVRESVPDWLDELCAQELGEEQWSEELHALNQPAKLCVRINTLRATVETVKQKLREAEVLFEETTLAPEALVLPSRKNLRTLDVFKFGWLEVQDVSSQRLAPMVDAKPGMLVIDTCAGAGGKSLHLAALTKNEADILCLDINANKLRELEKRKQRAGASSISVKTISPPLLEALRNTADRLLIDAPCSGMGVLRRKPDAKWQLSLSFLDEVRATQAHLLREYSRMLKHGGKLVYSTCSILPSENEKQVEQFLAEHKDEYTLLHEEKTSPAQSGFDGFYIAVMQRH